MLPAFFSAIGSDRFLSIDELRAAVGDHTHLSDAWSLYRDSFDGFCETRLDPQGHHLVHPARATGTLESLRGEHVIVFGIGPSAFASLGALVRMRERVRVFTSPRGAEVLAANGITPDLVLVEHRTAIDAHHAARHLRDVVVDPMRMAPLVAAEWRTPRALLAGVAIDRLFVPDPLPTWGPWPATAVAMAAQTGAARIGLLGIDLGTVQQPDPAFTPLTQLLGLLARLVPCETIDCGGDGARKPGWTVGSLDSMVSDKALAPLTIQRRPAPSVDERINAARETRDRLSPIVDRAHQILEMGLRARAGQRVGRLDDAANEILSWGGDVDVRIDLQEGLGLSFLSRFWRTGIDLELGAALWRPIVLSTHELTGQADRLDRLTKRAAA